LGREQTLADGGTKDYCWSLSSTLP